MDYWEVKDDFVILWFSFLSIINIHISSFYFVLIKLGLNHYGAYHPRLDLKGLVWVWNHEWDQQQLRRDQGSCNQSSSLLMQSPWRRVIFCWRRLASQTWGQANKNFLTSQYRSVWFARNTFEAITWFFW